MGINLEQLVKILSLTQSDNDNEALNAIRTANKLMKRNDTTWEKVFKESKITQSESIIMHKRKHAYKMAPDEADGDFLFTAGVYRPWLDDLTAEGQRIVGNIVRNARADKSIAHITWRIFANGWDTWAKRENER